MIFPQASLIQNMSTNFYFIETLFPNVKFHSRLHWNLPPVIVDSQDTFEIKFSIVFTFVVHTSQTCKLKNNFDMVYYTAERSTASIIPAAIVSYNKICPLPLVNPKVV